VLPRSSIAAVLARRGDLNLTAAQVKDLERRDEELRREQGEIRERFNVPAGNPATKSPAFKGPGGAAGGRGGHGQGTQGSRSKSDDPKQRSARLGEELDGADTRAWLEAAAKLPPDLQEKATAIAEKFREDLCDQRERPGE
jgi:hypothetical protein